MLINYNIGYFCIIKVHPQSIGLEECGNKKRDVVISLRPHLPIREKSLWIDIRSPQTSVIDGICIRGDNKDFQYCNIELSPKHSINLPLKIKLRTTCGFAETGDKKVSFYLASIHVTGSGDNLFWAGFQFPQITVSLKILSN